MEVLVFGVEILLESATAGFVVGVSLVLPMVLRLALTYEPEQL